MPNVLDLENVINPDHLAVEIARNYDKWKIARSQKEEQWKEVRNYVFATDTKTTTNKKLPWRNSTTRPKLCQIRDNLHANYMAALFPTDKWFKWEAADQDSAVKQKAKGIEAYMRAKMRQIKFTDFVSKAVYDYIDYGNVFADVEYVNEVYQNEDGETVTRYMGPRPVRVSPLDIVFDITAASFDQSPKITRKLMSFGEVEALSNTMAQEEREVFQKIMDRIKENRMKVVQGGTQDVQKSEGFVADGFSSINLYYSSGMVELLIFEGDYYDQKTYKGFPNRCVVVLDRSYVIENEPIENWLGKSSLVHAGWRQRPDNIWAMGPLDNLVGMQYRIDHLENLKADVFDLIAFPPTKQKGYVEDWNWGPNEKILMDENADVEMLQVPAQALAADQQIYDLEREMEEMAGAPKEAMGIRSPGEKTAFEVGQLTTAASRMFEQKIGHFEEIFIEPLLNGMLEIARRNLDVTDVIKTVDDDLGVEQFMSITKADITGQGRLTPVGARHFATKNKIVQNLTNLSQTGIYQDPSVSVHFSGWKMAQLMEDALDLDGYGLVQKNVRVGEQLETQQLAQTAQESLVATGLTPTDNPSNQDLMPNDIQPTQPATP